MGADSNIEWCHHTFSPWWGCTRVSAACRYCYAEELSNRYGHNVWGANAPRRLITAAWDDPPRWNKKAEQLGERYRVFPSMCDPFEEHTGPMVNHRGALVDGRSVDAERARLFELIEATPHLDWLLLTKRPENVRALVPSTWRTSWPANGWLGATTEDQAAADARIPHLFDVNPPVRFLSYEPAMEAIDIRTWLHDSTCVIATEDVCTCSDPREHRVDWVIAGGESGSHARPPHPDWFREIRDDCVAAGVPFFFKQWGEWAPTTGTPVLIRRGKPHATAFMENAVLERIGKKEAGHVLDGQVWQQLPDPLSKETTRT